MRRFDDEDLTGAEFRECDLSRARMVGVVMQDAEIDGLVTNLVVNGVEVMPYVEAELDRRHPVRLLIRSDRAGRPARGLAATAGRLGEDHRASPVHAREQRTSRRRRRVVDGRNPAPPCLRARLLVPTLRARAHRAVHGHGTGSTVRHGPGGERARPVRPTEPRRGARRANRQASEIETWLAEVTPDQLAQTAPVPTTTDGPRTPRGGQCGNASAPCSTRNGLTTGSANATWTNCRVRGTRSRDHPETGRLSHSLDLARIL